MDVTNFLHYVTEFAYVLVIFSFFLLWSIWAGRQSLINIICGVYVSSLLLVNFNLFNTLVADLEKPLVVSGAKIFLFFILALVTTKIFKRVMPREYLENKFESFGKKILLAVAATILVSAVSLTILPVTDFITPNTFILATFSNQELFFWWLLLPLVALALN